MRRSFRSLVTRLLRRRAAMEREHEPPALRGAPTRMRLKTYAAESGFAYQYYFAGYCDLPDRDAREFVFWVAADRKQFRPITVLIRGEEARAAADHRGRMLLDVERYAVAKLALLALFDRSPASSLPSDCAPTAAELASYLSGLGRGADD